MKKIVIFGGGSGLSQLLKGLKLFPVQITAVVTVADNGASTGRLRKELSIPAVGDITKVMLSMSNIDQDIMELMNYRFDKSKSIGNHSIKNLLLTALLDLHGSFDKAIPVLEKILDTKGTILPLTEDNVDLVGITDSGQRIIGEEEITKSACNIKRLEYSERIKVNPKIFKALDEADLVVFSSGSLLTSILPHLLDESLVRKINDCKALKMYVCNLFTQPGETDGFTVYDHVKLLESYLSENTLDIVIANNTIMNNELALKYKTAEQKDPVLLDETEFENKRIKLIKDNLLTIENNVFRHDSLKVGYLIFSCLMEKKK